DASASPTLATFSPAGVWFATALVLVVVRIFATRFHPTTKGERAQSQIDRVIARLVAFALAWMSGAVLWILASIIFAAEMTRYVAAVGGGSSALFAWLRRLTSLKPSSGKL